MQQPQLEHAQLEGEQVRLRPLVASDAQAAFPLIHERPGILEWLIWQGPASEADLATGYERWIIPSDNGFNYRFAIIAKATESFSGTIALRFMDHPFIGDVGYWVAEESWGRGYGTEAVALIAHLAFRHLRTEVLSAEVFLGNEGSCRVLERNGFVREKRPIRGPAGDLPAANRLRWLYSLSSARFQGEFEDLVPLNETVQLVLHEP